MLLEKKKVRSEWFSLSMWTKTIAILIVVFAITYALTGSFESAFILAALYLLVGFIGLIYT